MLGAPNPVSKLFGGSAQVYWGAPIEKWSMEGSAFIFDGREGLEALKHQAQKDRASFQT